MSKDIKVGDRVFIDGDGGFCAPSYATVTEIKKRFDQKTGKEYALVCCGNQHYRGDTGECVKGALAYFLIT